MIERRHTPRADRHRRGRPAAADLHLLPPRARARGAGGADPAAARRPDRRRDRAGVPGPGDDDGPADHPREEEDQRRQDPLPRPRGRATSPAAVDGVLAVVYLVFNEGYLSSSADASPIRDELTAEAIRLARILRALLPDVPEVTGLLALMLLTEARRPVRVAGGELVPLHEQDRGGWDRALIAEGHDLVRECLARIGRPGQYQLLAAINAVHTDAPTAADTDWGQIATLYAAAVRRRAVADRRAQPRGRGRRARRPRGRAGRGGPARASTTYHPWHATRADLLRRLGRSAEAREAYDAALALTDNEAERAYLDPAARPARRLRIALADRSGALLGFGMTPPAPLLLPTSDEALGWVRDRTADGLAQARELVDRLRSRAAGRAARRAAPVGRGHPGAEQRRRRWRRCCPTCTRSSTCGPRARRPRSRSTSWSPSCARTAGSTTCSRRSTRPGSTRPRPGCSTRPSRSSGARASTRTTRPARGWPRSTSGSPRSTRSSAATSATTSAPSGPRPSSWPGCRRTGWSAHPADDEGLVTVTTDYPDAVPARMFVHDPDVRRDGHGRLPRARLARRTSRCCTELFDLRHEYANLVGYSDWASYDAAVKMIEKGPAIPEFIDRIAQAAQGPMERDLAVMLERYRAGRARRRGDRRAPTRPTTRSWSARSSTTSTPSWCAPTSPSRRCGRGCST